MNESNIANNLNKCVETINGLFEKYKDNVTVTSAEVALNEGDDRINDGQYR